MTFNEKGWDNIIFDPIGKKLKMLAEIMTCMGILLSVLGGIILVVTGVASMGNGDMRLIFVGILVAILGSLLSPVLGFTLYGFGEFIERITEIAVNTRSLNQQTLIEPKTV